MQPRIDPSLPPLAMLQEMQPDEIGRMILPIIAGRIQPHGFVPTDFARGTAERADISQNERSEYAMLLSEGIGFLDRAGMLVDAPDQVGTHFFRLSRAGARAASDPKSLLSTVGGQEARTLLHPRIAAAAMGDLDRGRSDIAVLVAFRELEIAVSERGGSKRSGKNTFYDAFAVKGKNRGALVPVDMDDGEASSLRELFAGAYGVFRNPPAHRNVMHDDVQAMRLLLMASTMLYVLDDIPTAASESP